MGGVTPPVGPWTQQWLTNGRFDVYMNAVAGDPERALALYAWNSDVAAAMQRDLGHLEVALRNHYDDAISVRYVGPGHWLTDPSGPVQQPFMVRRSGRSVDLNAENRRLISKAVAKAGGASALIGKVIAELSFGFWRYLATAARVHDLWTPYLRHAYPFGTGLLTVEQDVRDLHDLRNRIAHMEPIFTRNLAAEAIKIVNLCQMLNPQVAAFIAATSAFPALRP